VKLIDFAQDRRKRHGHTAFSLKNLKPKVGELQMDRLRSEDLKEEKVVTTPIIIVAGRHDGCVWQSSSGEADRTRTRPFSSVCPSRCSSARQRRLRSFAQFGSSYIQTAPFPFPEVWLLPFPEVRLRQVIFLSVAHTSEAIFMPIQVAQPRS
jgi:hypothetical protein